MQVMTDPGPCQGPYPASETETFAKIVTDLKFVIFAKRFPS